MTIGLKMVWGVPDKILPIIDAPEGKRRVRFRSKGVATLFVKTNDGLRRFVLKEEEGKWKPAFETGRNLNV